MKKMKNEIEFKPNDTVSVDGHDGYAQIISIEEMGEYHKINLFFPENKEIKSIIYPLTKISKLFNPLELVKSKKFDEGWKFNLFMDALRFRLAHEYDPFFSLSVTKIDVLPHQIDAVYKVIGSYEQRFLLADDTGLGKTIMTGMIIKELEARNRANRILIVVPAPLQNQWKREMQENFDLDFTVFKSDFVNALQYNLHASQNPWEKYNKVICSLDYSKREEVMVKLDRTKWDLIVFDEAHKLSATKWGGKDVKKSERYKLAELMKDKTENLFLLTATPHSGDSYSFFARMQLLDPYLFVDEKHIDKKRLDKLMIRRLKEDVFDFEGKKLFPDREVSTLSVTFSSEEQNLYKRVTDYVSIWYNIAKQTKNRTVGFAMVILQKRMVSSIEAIRKSLMNRRNKLAELLKCGEKIEEMEKKQVEGLLKYLSDPELLEEEDMSDEERDEIERKLEVLTAAKNPKELKLEIGKLNELIEISEKIKTDTKAQKIFEFVETTFKKNKEEKILIFTEYRDTLAYLEKIFKKFDPAIIHGGLDMDKRIKAEEKFKHETNLMIATDAAGEGLNLQFAHTMINYELPWNPNRIEQRMGRLHRYGQKKKVMIFNLLINNTREGEIFNSLMEKINDIKKDMGDRVFDVLGILLNDIDIADMAMRVVDESKKEWKAEIAIKLEEAIKNKEKMMLHIEKESLIKQKLNLGPLKDKQQVSKETSVDELDVKRFFKIFFDKFEGEIQEHRNGLITVKTPKLMMDEDSIKEIYEKATFSKDKTKEIGKFNVNYISIGHPLMSKMMSHVSTPTFGGRVSIKLSDNINGYLFTYLIKTNDGNGKLINETVYSILYDNNGKTPYLVDPKIVWDLNDCSETKIETDDLDLIKNKVESFVMQCRAKSFEDIKSTRLKEVALKREYVDEFFNKKINDSTNRIREYKSKAMLGVNMDIAIRGEEVRLNDYQEKFKEIKEKIKKEEILLAGAPEMLSVCLILSKNKDKKPVFHGSEDKNKKAIEEAGMRIATEYEKSKGRVTEDVSLKFVGYDIKSLSEKEVRYIEVKSFAESGTVELTQNEWIMAGKLKDKYWLYVVENVKSNFVLNLIRNPCSKFKKYEIVPSEIRIKVDDWKEYIEERVNKNAL